MKNSALAILAMTLLAPALARAGGYDGAYDLPNGSQVANLGWSIVPNTNSAGLPDWRTIHVFVSVTITARNSEGFRAGTLTLSGGDSSDSNSVPSSGIGSGSTWAVNLAIWDSNPYAGKTYTLTLSGLSGWDSGNPDWSLGPSYATSPGVSGSGNTQASATITWSGGPSFVYDGITHTVTATVSPDNAGPLNTSGDSAQMPGNYSATASVTNADYTGSSTYNWSIAKADFTAPNAPSDATATAGTNWVPNVSGGQAIAGTAYCLAGLTHWLPASSPWYADPTYAGSSFTYWTANIAPAAYYNGTPCSDPGMTSYVLAVGGAANLTVAKTPNSVTLSNPGTPAAAVTWNWTNTSSTYNGASQGPSASCNTSYAPSGTWSATNAGSYTASATATGVPANSFTVTASVTGGQVDSWSSSGPISLVSSSGGQATFSITATGACFVTGHSNGNGTYLPADGTTNFNVTVANATSSQNWSINPANASWSWSGTNLTYNGGSQGPSLSANTPYSTGGTWSATNPGTYTATAASSSSNYIGSTSTSWTINQASQSITFTNPGSQTYGSNTVNLTASASSGLPVTFSVASGPATVSGSTLTLTGAGTVTLTANQAGSAFWLPASASQTFTVGKAAAVLAGFANQSFTAAYQDVVASYLAGSIISAGSTAATGAITYAVTGGGNTYTANGTVLTAGYTLYAGSYTVTASYPGDPNYSSGSTTATFTVSDDGHGYWYAAANLSCGSCRTNGAPGPFTTSTSYTITNTGYGMLNLTTVAVVGSFPTDFTVLSPSFPLALAPGQSTTVTVLFDPNTIGLEDATQIRIPNNSLNNPQGTTSVSGTGLDPQLDVSWGPLKYGP